MPKGKGLFHLVSPYNMLALLAGRYSMILEASGTCLTRQLLARVSVSIGVVFSAEGTEVVGIMGAIREARLDVIQFELEPGAANTTRDGIFVLAGNVLRKNGFSTSWSEGFPDLRRSGSFHSGNGMGRLASSFVFRFGN